LLIRPDYVELPLWRIRPDGTRMHAYDSDVETGLGSGQWSVVSDQRTEQAESKIQNPKSKIPPLLPRALFMTALVRLGMCDLFVHGFGGANYDRAMEVWIRDWLGVDVGPIAVVSATLRLTLKFDEDCAADVEKVHNAARMLWH